jgi:hypothetical protein
MKKRSALLAFLMASATSAAIWALSPSLTGHPEPWDAEGLFYFAALIVAGAIAGGLAPRALWAHYLGAVFGQLAYELIFLKPGPLFLVGAVFLLGYAFLFLLGAALGAQIRLRSMARTPAA